MRTSSTSAEHLLKKLSTHYDLSRSFLKPRKLIMSIIILDNSFLQYSTNWWIPASIFLNKTIRWYFYTVNTVIAAEKVYSTSLRIYWLRLSLHWFTCEYLHTVAIQITADTVSWIYDNTGRWKISSTFWFWSNWDTFIGTSVRHNFRCTNPDTQRDVWLKQTMRCIYTVLSWT